jgi:ketosteroid isomerase-like protein
MQSWLAGIGLGYVMRRLRAGDPGPTLLLDAPEVTLTFPGNSSWAGVYRGKPAVERWLRRFVAAGLQIYPDEVVVTGWPGNTTACIRGRIHLRDESGAIVYENRFVIWGHLAWGRMRQYEVYEDTQASARLDAWLSEHRPELAGAW